MISLPLKNVLNLKKYQPRKSVDRSLFLTAYYYPTTRYHRIKAHRFLVVSRSIDNVTWDDPSRILCAD